MATGNDLTVEGITSDGYVAFYDHTNHDVGAVSLGGGAVKTISSSLGTNFQVYTVGPLVFLWTNLDANNVGDLVVWSAADGTNTLSTASTAGWANADASSRYVVYATDVDVAANTCNLYAAESDGTQQVALLSGIEAPTNLAFLFAGDYVVVNSGTVTGGTTLATQLTSFTLGTWVKTALTATFTSWGGLQGTDAAGTKALYVSPTGSVGVYPLAGGTSITVGAGSADVSNILLPDGDDVLYVPAAETSLDHVALPSLATTVLGSGTSLSAIGLSPDTDTVLLTGGTTPGDLLIGSAVTTGTFATIAANSELALLGFTPDSSRYLYWTGVTTGGEVGNLNSYLVATSANTQFAANVYMAGTTTSGATVIFTENYATTTADLAIVNLATTSTPTVIEANVHPEFGISADGTKIAYSWSQVLGATAGIYVVATP